MADERENLGGAIRGRVSSFFEMPRREMLALAALVLLAVGGAGFAYVRARPLPPLPAAIVAAPSPSPSEPSIVIVHVVGAVRRPGVYELASGARVADAVALAGGLGPRADAAAINLARPVTDGEQIWVPARGQAPPAASGNGDGAGGRSGGAPSGGGSSGGKLNINLASEKEFEALPGIGPVLAERIVQYRTDNGPFAAVKDLMKVPGIGQKKYASLEPHITV